MGEAFTRKEFIDWLKTKDLKEEYNYVDNDMCATAQFLKETGRSSAPNVSPTTWENNNREEQSMPTWLDRMGIMTPAQDGGTFGGLLKLLDG